MVANKSAHNPKPKKSLGQNFLTSIPARNAIIKAGDLKIGEKVLEIGPGKGMLTSGLFDAGVNVLALEKDRELVPYLNEKFADAVVTKKLTITECDVLTFDPATSKDLKGEYKLIANIPYYITGAILSHFLTSDHQPSTMVVLVQKEVAERIVARDNKHSLLSLSVHAYGVPKLVYRVSKGSFNPIPNVDSAVLAITEISHKNFKNKKHEQRFFEVLHSGFAHKRKFLIRNLESISTKEKLEKAFVELSISPKSRSEDISLSTWLSLSSLI
jgi:16S rRNA (adenine1518-N6/adenine1519-N6)-dimethyltransferase